MALAAGMMAALAIALAPFGCSIRQSNRHGSLTAAMRHIHADIMISDSSFKSHDFETAREGYVDLLTLVRRLEQEFPERAPSFHRISRSLETRLHLTDTAIGLAALNSASP